MKFYKCYYLEPTLNIAHGATKKVIDGVTKFIPDPDKRLFICLDNGTIIESDFDGLTIRHISLPYCSYTEVKLFDNDLEPFTADQIAKPVVPVVVEPVIEKKRGRKSA